MDTNKQNEGKPREEIDRHLQSPGEANRDKHINFTALERGEEDPADIDDSKVHLTDDSTLQTRDEKERDDRVDPREDRTISVSEDDLNDAKAGRLTGREENEEGGLNEGRGIVDRNIQ
jgi:hypothetical protein